MSKLVEGSFLALREEGGVATVTMSRTPVNAMGAAFAGELADAFGEVAASRRVNVLVLESSIHGFFMAGADLVEFQAGSGSARRLAEEVGRAFDALSGLEAVTIAAIDGHTLGGGLELALCCDLRYAADGRYLLGLPEVTLGLLPGGGGTQRLPRFVGSARALEWMILGCKVSPEEACRAGLVQALFPEDRFREEVLRVAAGIASGPAVSIRAIKKLVRSAAPVPDAAALAGERESFVALFDTADTKEGIRAFLAREKPRFQGK